MIDILFGSLLCFVLRLQFLRESLPHFVRVFTDAASTEHFPETARSACKELMAKYRAAMPQELEAVAASLPNEKKAVLMALF